MDAATGEYILFLDPDDYYEPTLLSTLYAVLQEKQRDIVLFGYTEDYLDADGKMSYRVTKSLPGADFCGLCESLDEGGDNGVEKKILRIVLSGWSGRPCTGIHGIRRIAWII